MRKLKRAYFVIFLVAMLSAPFFLPGPNGKPVMTVDDLLPDLSHLAGQFSYLKVQLHSIKQALLGVKNGAVGTLKQSNHQPISVYRWRDEEGNWHFSDEVPEKQKKELEVITVDSSRIAPFPKLRERPEDEQDEKAKKKHKNNKSEKAEDENGEESLISHPLEALKKYPDIMKNAESVREQFNERQKKQKEILDGL